MEHQGTASDPPFSEITGVVAELRALNAVDFQLYAAARELFDVRFRAMLTTLPASSRSRRFRKRGGAFVLVPGD